MKLIVVGDLHGKDYWKQIQVDKYEKIIFIGDYLDSRSLSDEVILKNFEELLLFKKKYHNKVVLLMGNHETHYIIPEIQKSPGYRTSYETKVANLLESNIDLFIIAFQLDNFLFTHAGLSKAHFDFLSKNNDTKDFIKNGLLADSLNNIQKSSVRKLLHTVSPVKKGFDSTSGITVADKSETENSILEGYHQIVGHTPTAKIERKENALGSITYIDVLGSSIEFYEISL